MRMIDSSSGQGDRLARSTTWAVPQPSRRMRKVRAPRRRTACSQPWRRTGWPAGAASARAGRSVLRVRASVRRCGRHRVRSFDLSGLRLGAVGTVCVPQAPVSGRCYSAHTRRSLSSLWYRRRLRRSWSSPFLDTKNALVHICGRGRHLRVIGLRGATTVRSAVRGEPWCGSGRRAAAAGAQNRCAVTGAPGACYWTGAGCDECSRAGSGVSVQRRGGRPHSVCPTVGRWPALWTSRGRCSMSPSLPL